MDSAAAAERSGEPVGAGLTETEREILSFEKQWWQFPGTKEKTIREMFQLSPTRYYQVLNDVIDKPAALAVDPLLVRRLLRLRASRQKQRSARRFGIEL